MLSFWLGSQEHWAQRWEPRVGWQSPWKEKRLLSLKSLYIRGVLENERSLRSDGAATPVLRQTGAVHPIHLFPTGVKHPLDAGYAVSSGQQGSRCERRSRKHTAKGRDFKSQY